MSVAKGGKNSSLTLSLPCSLSVELTSVLWTSQQTEIDGSTLASSSTARMAAIKDISAPEWSAEVSMPMSCEGTSGGGGPCFARKGGQAARQSCAIGNKIHGRMENRGRIDKEKQRGESQTSGGSGYEVGETKKTESSEVEDSGG